VFFNIGIENLFKTPIKDVMDNAEQVAGTYIDDMKLNMKNFVVGLGSQIGSCISGISFDREKMGKILEEETTSLKVEAVLLQVIDKNAVNIVAKTPFSLSIQFEELPEDILYLSDGGVVAWESGDLVISAIVINRDFGLYLIASTLIDEIILDHKHKIKTGVMEYTNLETQRAGLKLSFITFFSVITILLLSLSVLAGVIFANWVLRPVNKLIVATRNVTSGNYDTPIRALKSKNEFDVLISTFNDMMSKLEQQKQQLIISNKQNAWRDIARKIAHEIKNPLTPIQLSAERLKSKYKNEITTTPDVFNTCIDTIIRQVQCIGNLVKEFSDFARMPAPQVTDTDIVKLIKESVFIQANTHKHIRFQQTYAQSEFICKIDPSQMNQVMMNILQNAINSIIEAKEGKNETVGNVSVSFHVKDGAMHLLIEDDGPGFSDASIKKAIDPYYTTREMGTGLGLAIVHKIITDHSGKIILERSKIFGGAKVIIQIPIN
jgi:two-component system nitrogen regulation sensor histidine kinase NtrY